MAIISSDEILLVDSIPTHTPTGTQAKLARLVNTNTFYIWNGSIWLTKVLETITASDGVESVSGVIKLGDDAAGTTEPGVLTSGRFINQDGNDVTFVGANLGGVTEIVTESDGELTLRNYLTATGEDAILKLSAKHNAIDQGYNPFIIRFPGKTTNPAEAGVVPYVLHAVSGGDPTGFNQALQSDYVYTFGINEQGTGFYNPLRGGIGMNMELYFDALDSARGRQELHFVHYLPGGLVDGGGGRFFTYEGFETQTLGSSAGFQTGRDDVSQSSFVLRTQEGADRVVFDWGAQIIRVKNSIRLAFDVNNTVAVSQINAAGNSQVEIAKVDANDNVVIANSFVFDGNGEAIHRSGAALNLGTDTNPVLQGVLITSSNSTLLKLKEDADADTWAVTRDAATLYIGKVGAQTTAFGIAEDATANALYVCNGGISVPGQSSGLARIVTFGSVGGNAIAAWSVNTANDVCFFAVGTVTGSLYAFNTSISASDKVIARIGNVDGDVELQLDATTAGETAVVKFTDATSSWSVGVDKTNDSLYIYNGGDKLSGGTAIAEFTKAGNVKLLNLPTHADEAAAVTAGLATDTVYQTATGELRIKL